MPAHPFAQLYSDEVDEARSKKKNLIVIGVAAGVTVLLLVIMIIVIVLLNNRQKGVALQALRARDPTAFAAQWKVDGKVESEFEGLVATAAVKPNVVNQATDPWILEKGLCRIDGIGEDFIAVGRYATD